MTLHYCPEFPLERLRYRDLWELDELGRAWREALRDDIKERGIRTPLLVWNHHLTDPHVKHLSKKPYLLMNGRNRMWALRSLGHTHAPAIVSGECEYPAEPLKNAEEVLQYWPDGHMVVKEHGIEVTGKTNPKRHEYPL